MKMKCMNPSWGKERQTVPAAQEGRKIRVVARATFWSAASIAALDFCLLAKREREAKPTKAAMIAAVQRASASAFVFVILVTKKAESLRHLPRSVSCRGPADSSYWNELSPTRGPPGL